jgi:hypothetical protein
VKAVEKYELSERLLQHVEPEPWTEQVTDAVALERFQQLDAEERAQAQGSTR